MTYRGDEIAVSLEGDTKDLDDKLHVALGNEPKVWVTRVPCVGERICVPHPVMDSLRNDRALVVVEVLHWTSTRPGNQLGTAALITVREPSNG